MQVYLPITEVTVSPSRLLGGVPSAQIDTMAHTRLKAEQLCLLLALLVVGGAFKIGIDLVPQPGDIFWLIKPGGM